MLPFLLPPTKTTISCTKSTLAIGASVICTATVTGVYASLTGTATWTMVAGPGSVAFSSKTCTLSGGKCTVKLTGTVAGNVTIEAAYGGDPNNSGSSGTASIKIR